MKVKFFGRPNEVVNTRKKIGKKKKLVEIFNFDEKGEGVLDDKEDAKLIEMLKPHFKHEEMKRKRRTKAEIEQTKIEEADNA